MLKERAEIILSQYQQKHGAIPLALLIQILFLILKALLAYAESEALDNAAFVKKAKNLNFIERGVVKNQCKKLISDVDGSIDSSLLSDLIWNDFVGMSDEKAIQLLDEANFRLI